jgi:hypothetical protein
VVSGVTAAVHEAGHAWAYRVCRLPLRYVTMRPRDPRLSGICRVWKPRRIDIGVNAFVASAGPIAEAIFDQDTTPDDDYEWQDHLAGAVLAGGHDDLSLSMGMLDSPGSVDAIRRMLQQEWVGIEALASRLVADGTVGRDAFELLRASS